MSLLSALLSLWPLRLLRPALRPAPPPVRVLLVDDDATYARLVAHLLGLHGCAVDVSHRGRPALEMAAERRPDVALVDLGLPDVDGAQVAAVLDRRGIPVVIVSGTYYRDERGDVACRRWLVKPFDPDELVRVVREEAGAG